MIQFKELVPNPDYNPDKPRDFGNQPTKWHFSPANRPLQVDDVVSFLCNGRGRGNHLRVKASVTKVNKKTFKALELPQSYSPGTPWTVNIDYALEPGNGGIQILVGDKP